MSRRKSASPAGEAFRAEIERLRLAHHEAWLAREPGDGLATDWQIDPITGDRREVRVAPRLQAFPVGQVAAYKGSKCEGHRCP